MMTKQQAHSKRPFIVWLPLLISIAVAIGVLIGYRFNPNFQNSFQIIDKHEPEKGTGKIGRVEEILRFVESSYVDSLDNTGLLEDAINEILSELDPFSSYIPPEELEAYNDQLDGVFNGIGVTYILHKDTIYITDVIEESDAASKGIQRGDKIIAVGDSIVSGNQVKLSEISQIIKDFGSSTISLEILKANSKKQEQIELEIKDIPIRTAGVSYAVTEDIIYSRILRFSSNTYKQFIQSFEKLELDDKEFDLILDLRDNPGGYLPETIKILSQFIKEKQRLLTYTEGQHRKRRDYKTTGKSFFKIDEIVVLINQNSASGSEIIAGALQDWDRAVILGSDSYGKGLVQEIYELKNGGALRLTVARYMTPTGRSIQKPYALQDSILQFEGEEDYASLIYQRSLYGGGGIKPDIEIEQISPFENCDFDFQYLQAFLLEKYPLSSPYSSFEEFNSGINITEKDYDNYVSFANDFSPDIQIVGNCEASFEYLVKTMLADFWYGDIEEQNVKNQTDPIITRAIDIIENNKLQALLTKEN